jgi:hypothetical protein
VVPAFDAAQGFAYDKLAHTPCTNLRADLRCTIHDDLEHRGFPSCAAFDCYGAGQRVTQQLFAGQSWQSSPELAARMFAAYPRYRAVHELLALLELAIPSAPDVDADWLRDRYRYLEALCETGEVLAADVRIDALRRETLRRVRRRE